MTDPIRLVRYRLEDGTLWPGTSYHGETEDVAWNLRYGIGSLPLNKFAAAVLFNAATIVECYELLTHGLSDAQALDKLRQIREQSNG